MWLLLEVVSGYRKKRREKNVQVPLDIGGFDLGRQSQGVQQELTQRRGRGSLLVNDGLDVAGDTVDHAEDLLNGALEGLNVSEEVGGALLGVAGGGNGLQTTLFGLAVADLVGHGDEGGAVGGSLGGDTDGGRDVGAGLDVLAGLSGHGEVDGRVGERAVALAAVEVLDQGGEGVQLGRRGVPTHQDLLGVGLEMQGEHLLLIFHIHLDLVRRLRVSDSKGAANFHLGAILRPGSEKRTDDTLLIGVATKGVIEDREEGLPLSARELGRLKFATYLGLNHDVQRGSRRGRPDGHGAQRTSEMQEGISCSHGEVCEGDMRNESGEGESLVGSGSLIGSSAPKRDAERARLKLCVRNGNFALR
jgi:hypothetical protein